MCAFFIFFAAAAAAAATTPYLTLQHTGNTTVRAPRILLGTGGGDGGFDAGAWLQNGGAGFDTAQTYCYFTSPKRNGLPASACSQVAIANALSVLGVAPQSQFIVSKIEPEDFGALNVFSGFGRVFDRGILQEMTLPALDMLMFHQAGRSKGAANPRPPCFNASAGDEGTYAACRVATFAAMQQLVRAGTVRSIGVSNFQRRDLEQLYNATGAWPSALELEVHP